MSQSVELKVNDNLPQEKVNDNLTQDESSDPIQPVASAATGNDADLQGSLPDTPEAREIAETTEQKGRTLKGMLMMVVCCAAPVLLLAAVGLFGVSLTAVGSGFLSVAALLACPVGMYLMMRMMMKNNNNKE